MWHENKFCGLIQLVLNDDNSSFWWWITDNQHRVDNLVCEVINRPTFDICCWSVLFSASSGIFECRVEYFYVNLLNITNLESTKQALMLRSFSVIPFAGSALGLPDRRFKAVNRQSHYRIIPIFVSKKHCVPYQLLRDPKKHHRSYYERHLSHIARPIYGLAKHKAHPDPLATTRLFSHTTSRILPWSTLSALPRHCWRIYHESRTWKITLHDLSGRCEASETRFHAALGMASCSLHKELHTTRESAQVR